jgi:hypothetical protein
MRRRLGLSIAAILLLPAFAVGCSAGAERAHFSSSSSVGTADKSENASPSPADFEDTTRNSGSTSGARLQTESPSPESEALLHPGCGEYCQTAGGYGGDDSDHPGLVEIAVDDPVVPLEDGTIPVQITCSTDLDCEGAVIVAFSSFDDMSKYGDTDGRCDLFVEAGRSQIFAVPLSEPMIAALNETAEAHLNITADAGLTLQRLPPTEADNYQFPTDLKITVTVR